MLDLLDCQRRVTTIYRGTREWNYSATNSTSHPKNR
jgi:hypothetical protein